ncbi:hypothetical protein C5167_020780 [Papaver somniferum]|uniref:Beta-mannosidase n=1 Tax=Papaver somniferum TaxID=3469 RepID=A0A4Y7IXZ4_PAPSO|nr:hypothetical protein C5167_020780 [Papaver somniferum]
MAKLGKTNLDSGWIAARSTEIHLAARSTEIHLAARSTEIHLDGIQLTTTHPPSLSSNSSIWIEAVVPGTYKGYLKSVQITDILHPDGNNLLAVLVHPPDHPGTIPPEGGQGGDHEIGKDVAAQYVEGWDWMMPIRDRNTGIWDEVSISVTGVSTELEGNMFLIEHHQTSNLSIPPGAHIDYTLPKWHSYFTYMLFFYKPNLWWPNGMGKQSLYNVEITVEDKGFGESDSWSQHFGFRKIESSIDNATGGRLFKVNGQPIFIRGGNWILSDGLLRLSKERYETDIQFHTDMNFNMIRCWGGGLAERLEFYHYCDIYGLLVWQEFWITGDCDGRGVPVSNPDGPLDHGLFLICARDTVKLLRNHPSLALWVGGNEQTPPDDINKALKNGLKLHPLFKFPTDTSNSLKSFDDPSKYLDGTRDYIQGSMWDGFANGKGDFTDGPYEIQNPVDFFKDDFYNYGFNPEVGSVGIPVAATIRATMPEAGWKIPLFKKLPDGYIEEVENPIWKYHKYIPYSNPKKGVSDQIELYGIPKDLDDFCEKAQLVNYIQYRALLEGWTSRMWTKYTGVLIWKTQNPWTGLRSQFYDHLHDQTAGFYGCHSAAEPIHVQLNLATYFIEVPASLANIKRIISSVFLCQVLTIPIDHRHKKNHIICFLVPVSSLQVVNTTADELIDVAVEASVWDLDGTCPYYKVTDNISVPAKTTQTTIEMKYPKTKNAKPVYFLLLKLFKWSNKAILSRNFYWLHLLGGNYKLLEPYRKKQVPLKIISDVMIRGSTYKINMTLQNRSKTTNMETVRYRNHVSTTEDLDMGESFSEEKRKTGLLHRVYRNFSKPSNEGSKVVETNGMDSGVAFFLRFCVHSTKKNMKEGEDTRILPVHYSDNYFSMVPGEKMTVTISFKVPPGVTPRVTLLGWNCEEAHSVY